MKKIVTLTNRQIVNAQAALVILGGLKIAILPGFRIAQNRAEIAPHAKNYQEFRQGIFKRHAKQDSRGNVAISNGLVQFETPEAEETALAEIAELEAIEVQVEIRTVALAAIAGDDNEDSEAKKKRPPVEPDVLGALMWMIVEEEGE